MSSRGFSLVFFASVPVPSAVPVPVPPPLSEAGGLSAFESASLEEFAAGFGIFGLLPPFFFFLFDLDLPLEAVGDIGVGRDLAWGSEAV